VETVTNDLDDQIKRVELALKQQELDEKLSWWSWLKHPGVVAALITAWVAIASGVFGWVTSHNQGALDQQKFKSQLTTNILLDTIKDAPRNVSWDPRTTAIKLKIFYDTGLLFDETGSIRAFLKQYSLVD
jgi:hypothetical protein